MVKVIKTEPDPKVVDRRTASNISDPDDLVAGYLRYLRARVDMLDRLRDIATDVGGAPMWVDYAGKPSLRWKIGMRHWVVLSSCIRHRMYDGVLEWSLKSSTRSWGLTYKWDDLAAVTQAVRDELDRCERW